MAFAFDAASAVSPRAFTELGLALDITGAILLYFFGLPHGVLIDDSHADFGTRVEHRYPRIARVCKRLGLPLLIAGFIGQWIGVAGAGRASVGVVGLIVGRSGGLRNVADAD